MNDQQLLTTAQHIGGLLYKRSENSIGEIDQVLLNEWLKPQPQQTKDFIEDISRRPQIGNALKEMYSFDQDAALLDVQSRISLLSSPDLPPLVSTADPEKGNNTSRLYRWLAAFSALTLIAAGMLIYAFHGKQEPQRTMPVSQRFKNDIAPGDDRAILQLADGSRIVLDDSKPGIVATQGTTKIVMHEKGSLSYQSNKSGSKYTGDNIISTPRAGQYQLTLPDGTKVWLNNASTLQYPTAFMGKSRTVTLQGEAYFQVASHPAQPFVVNVMRNEGQTPLRIQALGTEFNIMAYSDETDCRTTLITGAIRLNNAGNELTLRPGQQARVNNGGSQQINLINTTDPEDNIAWKGGLFRFQDASIQDIMRQIGRWYDIEVTYKGTVDQHFIGTIPRDTRLTTLLTMLESTGWVHFAIDGRKITVSR